MVNMNANTWSYKDYFKQIVYMLSFFKVVKIPSEITHLIIVVHLSEGQHKDIYEHGLICLDK